MTPSAARSGQYDSAASARPAHGTGGVRDTTARRLAWTAFVVIVLLYAIGFALSVLGRSAASQASWGTLGALSDGLFAISTFSFPLVGLLIVTRQPKNPIGWILLGVGLCWGADAVLSSYAGYAATSNLAHADLAAALDSWLWVPAIGVMGTFLLLLFPDGRLPSPRWKKLAWLSAFVIAGSSVGVLLQHGSLADEGYPGMTNPLGNTPLTPVLVPLQALIVLIPICIIASAVSLVGRFRRSRGTDRLQLKWLTTGAAAVALVYLIAMVASLGLSASSLGSSGSGGMPLWVRIIQDVALFSFGLIPAAIGIAILKHRLFDIDLVINKAVVFGTLAGFITAVYVAIVVGIGSAIGHGSSGPNLGLSILATAVVAVAFQPARDRVQRFANRLVYGKRASPYEVLSEFASRMGGTFANEDLLPRMAQILAEGTGAKQAAVWLRVGNELRPEAAWPHEDAPHEAVPLATGRLPELHATLALPVDHLGELLGALSLIKPPGERLTPAEENLAKNLASQAGLVLRNVRLTEELLQRLDELQASRQRIVAAQDEERRRLERNLHDGAQQQLVALAIKVRLAGRVTARDPARASLLMEQAAREVTEALEVLRDLARGIYPPLLADQGLVTALESQTRKAALPVAVEADRVGRYSQETEAAVYFCTLEALQNVAKYAQASRAVVRLTGDNGHVTFQVADDGVGFVLAKTPHGTGLQGMGDRLAALGGELDMDSTPGEGTTITGRLPATARNTR